MKLWFWIIGLSSLIISFWATTYSMWFWGLFLFCLVFFSIGIWDILQKKQTIRKNFPIFGWGRYIFEALRPKLYQYFIESDLDGKPINRISRSVVYQRAKKQRDTIPFGTQLDVYEPGYEWINHSLNPLNYDEINHDPRIEIGGKHCLQKYNCSILNISAMSYGSLSGNAVMALNKGSKLGNFAQNTGEGGVAPQHLKHDGDLIWQLGTGYFGARASDGNFDVKKYRETISHKSIKMVELKLSQGAKPGHGGILPASKNNEIIAKIRGVEPHTDVLSPPGHKAFSNNIEFCNFIKILRDESGGKPIGIKLCVGDKLEFIEMVKEMKSQDIYPDYIAVDGGEGGTGAAPLEFSNSIGTPMMEGLTFVHDVLRGFDLRDEIKIFASGKAVTGFDLVKMIALGADCIYSARAMMLALGCIQALECNSNHCPTGITTHKKELESGLDVDSKGDRVYSYHKSTITAFSEILGASGIKDLKDLKRKSIYRRINETQTTRFDKLYPCLDIGFLLNEKNYESYLNELI